MFNRKKIKYLEDKIDLEVRVFGGLYEKETRERKQEIESLKALFELLGYVFFYDSEIDLFRKWKSEIFDTLEYFGHSGEYTIYKKIEKKGKK